MKFTFDSQTNYKDTFREYVSELNNLKEVPTQEERHDIVASLLAEYYQYTEDLPPSDALNMLTVFYLKDWYTNTKSNKMKDDNSFHTVHSLLRISKKELGSHMLSELSTYGKSHLSPTRDHNRKMREYLRIDYDSIRLSKIPSFRGTEGDGHDET